MTYIIWQLCLSLLVWYLPFQMEPLPLAKHGRHTLRLSSIRFFNNTDRNNTSLYALFIGYSSLQNLWKLTAILYAFLRFRGLVCTLYILNFVCLLHLFLCCLSSRCTASTKVKDTCPEDCGMGHCSGYKCICPDGYFGRTCQLSKYNNSNVYLKK